MGCELFEIGVLRMDGRMSLRSGWKADQIDPPFPPGAWLMMSIIVYQPSLEHLNSELKLDAKQQVAVQDLMIERRTQLLALIDKSPPPTLGFGPLP